MEQSLSEESLSEGEVAIVAEAMRSPEPLAASVSEPLSSSTGEDKISLMGAEQRVKKFLPLVDVALFRLAESVRDMVAGERKTTCDAEHVRSEFVNEGAVAQIVNSKNARCLLTANSNGCPAVLMIDAKLVADLIERKFGGGKLQMSQAAERELTPLERKHAATLALKITEHINKTLGDLLRTQFTFQRVYERVEPVLLLKEYLPAVKLGVHFKVSEFEGQLTLLLPVLILEMAQASSLAGQAPVDLLGWRKSISQSLNGISVELVVELGSSVLDWSELVSLTPGKIIRLNQNMKESLPIHIDGQAMFLSRPMMDQGRLGLKIDGFAD